MKKQLLLPALLFLGFAATISSCKKNDDDDAVNPSKQACTADRIITSTDSTQVTYDSENRVIKEQTFTKSGNSLEYTLYTYSSNKIVEKTYDESGDLTEEINYHLNSNKNVAYSVSGAEANVDDADTTWYTYDSNKRLTRTVTKNTTSSFLGDAITRDTSWFTYTGSNLTKIETSENGGDNVVTIFSYGSDDAKSEFLLPLNSSIQNLYGETSEKLPVSATTEAITLTYVYTFNSEGYVTRYRVNAPGNTNSYDATIVYNCK
jgi:hypothetical protein